MLPTRRPDQYERPGSTGALGAGFPSTRPVRRLAVGSLPSPQVIIDSTLNYTVRIINAISGVTPANVASVANINAAVRFPSNNPSEVSPPLIAETLITFTNGAVADALLTLSGFTNAVGGQFAMNVSGRAAGVGSNAPALLTGWYQVAGSTITLTPYTCDVGGFGLTLFSPSKIQAADLSDLNLINLGDPYHSLGSTGLAGDAGSADYKMSAENELILSIHKSFNALGGITTASFANPLGAAFIPPNARLTGGDPISLNGAAPGAGTRLTITFATGVVNLVNLPAGTTAVGCDVRIPLA